MPAISRQQMIAWSAAGLAVLLIGGNYLRGQIPRSSGEPPATVTVGIKTDHASRIKIHVTGAVAHPGVYEIDSGARAEDALRMAGGALPDADLNQINLAAKLADGQQIAVPPKGAAAGADDPAALGALRGVSTGQAGPVNLNSATVEQLDSLDGIGPKTAQKIIEYRESHGGFSSTDELMEVPGIGAAKYERIKGQVTV